MNVEMTRSGVRILREDGVSLFYAPCSEHFNVDAGCWWMLSPDYRTFGWVAQHGANREAALVLDREQFADPFDPATIFEAIADWLDRCHEYEAISATPPNASAAVTRIGERPYETLGWQPGCSCYQIECVTCGVLELVHGKETSSTNKTVSDLSRRVPPVASADEVLQQEVLRTKSDVDSGASLPTVPEDVSTEGRSNAFLQQGLRGKVDGATPPEQPRLVQEQQGLHPGLQAGASGGVNDGICTAAPTGDGGSSRKADNVGRGRPSQERHQGRQPTGEPGSAPETSTRQPQEADVHGDVPRVRVGVSRSGECPRCRGRLVATVPPPIPATILDPFFGAGTVGLVASRLNRDAILCELNPESARLAEERINDDAGPLLAEPVTVDVPQQASLFADEVSA